MNWPEESGQSWVRIPEETREYSATLTGDLKYYLENASKVGQFAKDPGLRDILEEVEKRAGTTKSTYLVVEEAR